MPDSIVTIVGALGAPPELRFTQSGKAVASFNVAVNRRYQQNNEWVEETSWFRVNAWGELGENASASLLKGARVIVTGRLEQRTWEAEGGEKRHAVEIVADEIGPSLRWATAEVTKTNKSSDQQSRGTSSNASTTSSHGEPF